MIPKLSAIERANVVAPLGLRFRDALDGAPVADGLLVTIRPADDPSRIRTAFPNRAGIYVARDLPGLRAVESGAGDAVFWAAPPETRAVVVEVVDERARYQPCAFELTVPARSLAAPACLAAAPGQQPSVPLYSTPARPVPNGMAVVRASLWDALAKAPAAWAVLEVRVTGGPAPAPVMRGIADRRGCVALPLPLPGPRTPPPTNGHAHPLQAERWSLDVVVRYTKREPVPDVPDLCATLAQRPASVWRTGSIDANGEWHGEPFAQATLEFERELVLRSSGAPAGELWITPEESPV